MLECTQVNQITGFTNFRGGAEDSDPKLLVHITNWWGRGIWPHRTVGHFARTGVSREASVREVGGHFFAHTDKSPLILHKREVFGLPYLI